VFGEMPSAPEETEETASAFEDLSATDIPVTSEPAAQEPTVDKSAAVRELSNLFKQTEVDSSPTFMVPPIDRGSDDETVDEPETKKRVEDDEEITRGLISRLIDGVKGL
jgi:hypothetical protein